MRRAWEGAYLHKLIEEQVGHVNGITIVGMFSNYVDFLPDGSKEIISINGMPVISLVTEVP